MSEAGRTGIGKMALSRYETARGPRQQRTLFHCDPLALARDAASGAVARS